MAELNEAEEVEATDEQLILLRELGVSESELEGLSFASAEDLIAEVRAIREDAGKIGRD